MVFWSTGGLEAEIDDHADGVKAAERGLRYCTRRPGALHLWRDPSKVQATFEQYLQKSSNCIVNQLYEPEVRLVPRAALLLPVIPDDDASGGFGYSMLDGHLYFQSQWMYVTPQFEKNQSGCRGQTRVLLSDSENQSHLTELCLTPAAAPRLGQETLGWVVKQLVSSSTPTCSSVYLLLIDARRRASMTSLLTQFLHAQVDGAGGAQCVCTACRFVRILINIP